MKKAIYDKLEDIPQTDRDENNYQLAADGPNAGKYVLLIDGAHPVMVKNSQLLAKESQREIEKQQAVAAAVAPKDTEIARLSTELQTAKTQTGLPAGQVAVAAEDAQILNQFKALGAFDEVKAKLDEHGTLKEQTEAITRKTLFAEAAKAHGLDPEAFATLAEQRKLHEKLEMREVPDPKKPTEKVKHYFVKAKDANNADTSVVLGEFVQNDNAFKPFINSLTVVSQGGGNSRRIPEQGVGGVPKETSAAKSYINSRYKPKEAKAANE
jgi:hypothetical protein